MLVPDDDFGVPKNEAKNEKYFKMHKYHRIYQRTLNNIIQIITREIVGSLFHSKAMSSDEMV
jgi:hypothetical protein